MSKKIFIGLTTYFLILAFFAAFVGDVGAQPRNNKKPNDRAKKLAAQGDQLFPARRLVDAVDHRRGLAFERLGRRDIGRDHEILDHPVRIEPFADRDFGDTALVVEDHPAFG